MAYSEGIYREESGDRLRQERKRLGLTQQQMADIGGVRKQAQLKYEAGQSSPNAEYLALVQMHGVDVQFVLTAAPSSALAGDEAELLRRFRTATPELRAAALAVLATSVSAPATVISGGEQGQVVTGSQTNHAPLTINVGGKKGGKNR
ncbi:MULTISPECIES: helix-turn-helix transcriptional regulator [unclassified Lysobacter]|uniref:helix-turn-helix domain-containing protein n=1 Tax=unclassified Lysobacter TaxID=2635362 RepID=UPI0006FAEFC2|nr:MULTISPECIES: helix-turn-helix transcriptional regulator [unclassified Lysobacter]KRC32041.1 hypothetical protein ASE10_15885 [Lysobacter sp. Root76]KRD67504.1 hypothetical protein ASE45_12060 [Lysobacter sp. Root96]